MKLENLFNTVMQLQDKMSLNISAHTGCLWTYEDNELTLNTDANEEDLHNGDGNTYGFECRYAQESDDGYVAFYDADGYCGTKETIILRKSEEV